MMKERRPRFKFSQEQAEFLLDNYKDVTAEVLLAMFNVYFDTRLNLRQIENKVKQMKISKRKLQESHGKYTEEMLNWLRKNYNQIKLDDLTAAFNRKFNTTFSKSALWHKIYRITSENIDRTREYVPRTNWTKEMVLYLKENYNDYIYTELALKINEKFNVKTTSLSVEHKIHRLGLRKSKLALSYQSRRRSEFWFKPGIVSLRRAPIGHERIDKNGTIWVKSKHPSTFETKQRFLYRQHHGMIPENMNIVFLNGDNRDFRIENLIALDDQELALFNTTKIKPNGNNDIAEVKLAVMRVNKIILKNKPKGNE